MKHPLISLAGSIFACLLSIASADTQKATPADFRVEVTLDAVVEAKKSHLLSVDPKSWATPKVAQVVSHGQRVRQGARILRLDDKPLREEIEATEKALPLATLARQQAELALRQLEISTPRQLAATKLAHEHATEALDYFRQTEMKQSIAAAKQSLQRAEQNLSYVQEELDQLTKMYEADDLTEETEEIIITRARNDVEAMRNSLHRTRLGTERALAVEIPRQLQALQLGAEQSELNLENARQSSPLILQTKRNELAKLRDDENNLRKKLKDLNADRALVELRAPVDGIVYYGAATNGKFVTAEAITKKLIPGGTIGGKEILFTLIETDGIRFKTTVPEEKLSILKSGTRGTAAPVYDSLTRIPIKLTNIEFSPQSSGGFNASAELAKDTTAPSRLTAGMNVKLHFVPINEKNVITVPLSAIHYGDNGPELKLENKDVPVPVKLGASDGTKVIIKSGIQDGDIIVL
jgi:HlyD family secretion protein